MDFIDEAADDIYGWFVPSYDSKQKKYTVRFYKEGPSKGTAGAIAIFKLKKYGNDKKKAYIAACEFFHRQYGFDCRKPIIHTIVDEGYVEYMKHVNE